MLRLCVQYDEEMVTYNDYYAFSFPCMILQPNRQGGDVGTQYRSAIFPVNSHQRVKLLSTSNPLTIVCRMVVVKL